MTTFSQHIVQAAWFQRGVLGVILFAGLLAGLETSAAIVAAHGPLLRWLNALVLVVFLIEIVLKLATHGRQPWRYFRDGWNVFDFIIVAFCCLPMDSQFAAVLRLARGLRLLRLVTALPRLQLLVGALLKSLGAMGYVSLLLALLFYIYGVAGVHLFGHTDPAHFGSLGAALLTLFQIITLENWSSVFNIQLRAAPVAAVIYFISFIVLGTMIMLNLFIGIILNSMSEMHAEIAERDRSSHIAQTGEATPTDDVAAAERQLAAAQEQLARLRHRLQRSAEDAG